MNISRPSRNHVGVTIDINLAPFKKFHCNFLQRMFTLNDCIRNVPYILRNCIKQFQLFRNTLNVKNYYRNDLLKKKAIIRRLEDRFQDLLPRQFEKRIVPPVTIIQRYFCQASAFAMSSPRLPAFHHCLAIETIIQR